MHVSSRLYSALPELFSEAQCRTEPGEGDRDCDGLVRTCDGRMRVMDQVGAEAGADRMAPRGVVVRAWEYPDRVIQHGKRPVAHPLGNQ